jgi:CRP-like cAMP-binding protein/Fe-S-cluster-containing hydrogenase component 2
MNGESQAPDGATILRRSEQHRDRWSSYHARNGILQISERLPAAELARFEIFASYDEPFLERISPEVSVCRWQAGAVLFEEGSYIDLAFFILDGKVEVSLKGRGAAGAAQPARPLQQPIFDVGRTKLGSAAELARLMATAAPPEPPKGAAAADRGDETVLASRRPGPGGGITFLAAMDFNLPVGATQELGRGELFGEIGAMSGWPQSVTARTVSECLLVQIRLPALAAMRRRDPALKERLDKIYRDHTLGDQLKTTPLLSGCDAVFIEQLAHAVELVSCEPGEVIAEEGGAVDALYLVRSGFVKLTQHYGEGTLVVNYLSKGMTLGETELLIDDAGGWTATATSVEYAELVKMPRPVLRQLFAGHPAVEKMLWESAVARIREAGFSRRNLAHSSFIQVALDNGLVEGNSILVIDLENCTRCDDCVRGCAATHGGRPRFVREGEKIATLEVVNACYHCRDPVCLVGCPTGAIHRAGVGDVVAIDERICIGCQTCARSCPYDAIVMHPTGETWPADMVPESLRGKERLVASKCDLCHTDPLGPACVRSCPNGCAYRVGSLEEFERLLSKRR